jgi:hypothetical protein
MTWIKSIPFEEVEEKLRRALEARRALYPAEYAQPVLPTPDGETSGIVPSHNLIPDALYHASPLSAYSPRPTCLSHARNRR